MNKKTSNSIGDTTNKELSEKDQFVAALQRMAGEQRRLEQTSVMPRWMGPVNSAIGTNAFVLMLIASWFVSVAIFLVKFPFFFELGRRLL
ncbi:MAG: hypothetical protein AAB612_02555 [Patescibacteria group bacterium]